MHQSMPSKCHGDRNVARIAASANHDPTDSASVVASIKSVPLLTQKNFEPGAEVHWVRTGSNPNIAQIARDVTRGKIQATAQRDRQVSKVAANADSFMKRLKRCSGCSFPDVGQTDIPVDKVTDRLYALPT